MVHMMCRCAWHTICKAWPSYGPFFEILIYPYPYFLRQSRIEVIHIPISDSSSIQLIVNSTSRIMKGCKSFFKLYHLRPLITQTSNCVLTPFISHRNKNMTSHLSRQGQIFTHQVVTAEGLCLAPLFKSNQNSFIFTC